jgi:uncharacterized protein (TIGR03663 family)
MIRRVMLIALLTAGVAMALRLPRLDERPMHNDEGVNALKFGQLWKGGSYKYDPNEHHGPTLAYATLLLGRLTRAPDFDHFTEARLRLLTVLFGVGLILLLPLTADALGGTATLWVALFTAVSPAMVFYSRDYIHESLLVFFTFLALGAGWRYWRARRMGWALLAGAGLGLMCATKETFVLTLAAAVLALGLNQVWNRLIDASSPPIKSPRLNPWHLAAAFGVGLLVAVALFSSFFTDFGALLDFFRAFPTWINRAGGDSPHIHPWHFYLHRLLFFHAGRGPVWSEALVLALALVAVAAGFKRRRLGHANASFIRFLALYTFLLTVFYSVIAYKTPWCLLSFWQGTILLAGVGAAVAIRSAGRQTARLAVWGLLLVGAGHLAWQAWQAAVPYAADRRNPYVYAQTSPDLLDLVARIEAFAAARPEGREMLIEVMAPENDYGPLPWYLRGFKQVGWWDQVATAPVAPVMIVSSAFHAKPDTLKNHLMLGYFALRPQVLLQLYVQSDLWRAYLDNPAAKPERAGEP